MDSQRENNSNYGWLGYKTKSFIIINACLLMKAFDNKACLITFNGTGQRVMRSNEKLRFVSVIL